MSFAPEGFEDEYEGEEDDYEIDSDDDSEGGHSYVSDNEEE
jgi:hypothetical protein